MRQYKAKKSFRDWLGDAFMAVWGIVILAVVFGAWYWIPFLVRAGWEAGKR